MQRREALKQLGMRILYFKNENDLHFNGEIVVIKTIKAVFESGF